MFEKLSNQERIDLAKSKTRKVVDHLVYLIQLHANNSCVVYSPMLSSQIRRSFAANAFNIFSRSMHQFEIVRLCALWDSPKREKENIPTVVELIDSQAIIEMLAAQVRRQWPNEQFGILQAMTAEAELRDAIAEVKTMRESAQLESLMNLRDKHLAHSLTETWREKNGPIEPARFGDQTELLDRSIHIGHCLYNWVSGVSFDFSDSQRINKENAEALWKGCKFDVLK
jgi:hypothetical protein